jgi:hypothetical protein
MHRQVWYHRCFVLLLQVDVEQYYINRGEFDPMYHLQYLTGYKYIGGRYVAIDRLLPVSARYGCPPSIAISWPMSICPALYHVGCATCTIALGPGQVCAFRHCSTLRCVRHLI